MARNSRPLTVTLGPQQRKVDDWVRSGAYSSASEVLRAGVLALEREQVAVDDWIRQEVRQRLANPMPTVDADEVFNRLEAKYQAMIDRDEDL